MPTCCNEPVVTQFCPHCGKKSSHPLADLLKHLNMRVKVEQGTLDSAVDWMGLRPENTERDKRNLEKRRAILAKWTFWRDELAKLISGGS